ncbi:MAG TPA: extracellular solute-binding protein [Candidatus Onthovivens sp.]|nr:extracellular solute-binding protein [Candidatus Onthovivens sp.]
MKKKFLLLAVLPLVLGTALASCKPDDPTPPEPVEGGFVKEATTITFTSIIGENNMAQMNAYIETFKKVEPLVTVNNIKENANYNGLRDKVVSGFTSGNYPDIVQAYPDHVADYIDYGKALKLDDYMNHPEYGWTAEDKADIVPDYLAEGQLYTTPGTYSVPFSKSTELMFYNEDVIHGLDLSAIDPTINNGKPLNKAYVQSITWEEMLDKLAPAILKYNEALPAGKKIITPKDGKSAVICYDSDDNLFITLAKQFNHPYTSVKDGEGSIDFNTKGMQDLLIKFNKYVKDGLLLTKGINNNAYTNELFTADAALFSIGSTGGVKYQFASTNPMNVGVALIPQPASGTKAVINQGPSAALLDHDDDNRSLASWLFYKHISNEENSLDWAINSGYNGIRLSNYESEEFKEATDASNKQAESLERVMALSAGYVAETTPYLFTSEAFKGSSKCRDAVGGLLTQALLSNNPEGEMAKLFDDAEQLAKLGL